LAADGTLTLTGTIPGKPSPVSILSYLPLDQPAGIAFANGNIFMANYFSINLAGQLSTGNPRSRYIVQATAFGMENILSTTRQSRTRHPSPML